MPNYRLPNGILQEINQRARYLAKIRLDYALDGIPLTFAQLQRSAMPVEMLHRIEALRADGVAGFNEARSLPVVLRTDQLPGLKRDVLLQLHLPAPISTKVGYYNYTHGGEPEANVAPDSTDALALDPNAFTADEQAALTAWANEVVRIRRHARLVARVVAEIVALVPTTAHIHARWPLLATLVDDKDYKVRLQHAPEKLTRYGWMPGALSPLQLGQMRAVEPFLLGAALLPELKPDRERVYVEMLRAYQALPGDRD